MSLASFAGNANATTLNANSDNIESIEKAKPHTQQYKDMKKVLDEYEQAVKKAQSCEDLENATLAMFFQIMGVAGNEYDEEMTEEENEELSDLADRIEDRVTSLQEQWGCKTDEADDEEEDDDDEMIDTSTEEWENIINEFDAIVTQMEKMQNLDFEDEDNANKLLEVIMPLQQISERMDHSTVDNITTKQTSRLEEINNRLVVVAKAIGLMEDDED